MRLPLEDQPADPPRPQERAAVPQTAGRPLDYRADIDGLRAVALLEVVLFHAQLPGFAGGYIGVDVFFVISGFLVTQLLLRGACAPLGIQLSMFYARRARRILPALFTVCLAVSVCAAWLYLPDDLERFGRFLCWVPFGLANLGAWFAENYFAADSNTRPLLHLWSIAVEEQFYLLFPLLLWLLHRCLPRHRRLALATLALLSFVLCCWASYRHPILNYYSPATRAWELLLGACVAVQPPRWRGLSAELAAGLALALLLVCGARYDASLHVPGLATAAPCLASTVLLVTGDGATRVSRLLGQRALMTMGVLSYSLYLWHWPALTLLRYASITPPSVGARLVTLVLAGLAALITWYCIERPVRRGVRLTGQRRFALGMSFGAALLMALAFGLRAHGGWPQRFSPEVQALAAPATNLFRDIYRCGTLSSDAIGRGELCHYGASSAKRHVMVWGDSHALVLLPAWQQLAEARAEHPFSVDLAARSSCRPLFTEVSSACRQFNEDMLRAVSQLRPDVVVFAAYWTQPAAPGRPAVDPTQWRQRIDELLARTRAPGRTLCLVLDAPILNYAASYALPMARRWGEDSEFVRVARARAYQDDPLQGPVRRLAAEGALQIVDLKSALCPGERCEVLEDGASLYRDRDHLSVRGALRVAATLEECLTATKKEPAS